VKRVKATRQGVELWPESNNPQWNKPLLLKTEESDGESVFIAGKVLASLMPWVPLLEVKRPGMRPGLPGHWGEQTLRNVLETAGLTGRYKLEQASLETDEGRRRPDVIVQLPGGEFFVIDAKCSLNAFLEAQDAVDEAAREAALLRHTQSVRSHMTALAAKTYWDQFKAEGSPDFVAMFVPGDGFLIAALDRAPDLMSEAMDRRVLLVTPTTLFALCKAIVYGWRVEDRAKNADEDRELQLVASQGPPRA
jgi:DNA recombination protein RmuC